MKIRIIQHGDETFTLDAEFAAPAITAAISGESGEDIASEVIDYTDAERSDIDRDEYAIVTEDDGTPLWSGWLGGVQGPPPASIAGDAVATPVQRLLSLKLDAHNDAGATDVRDYLRRLLAEVWRQEEGFSGRRPFGNSGWQHDIFPIKYNWQHDIYKPMIAAGLMGGKLDEDGYIEAIDSTDKADQLIHAAIDAMCRGEA